MAPIAEPATPTINGGDPQSLLRPRYTRWLLAVLLLVSTFNYTDRFIFSLLAEAIKRDLALTDLRLGILGGLAFALFHAIMGMPLARVAEVAAVSTYCRSPCSCGRWRRRYAGRPRRSGRCCSVASASGSERRASRPRSIR